MKRFACLAFTLTLLGGGSAFADEHDYYHHDAQHQHDKVHWSKGDTFSGHSTEVADWRARGFRRPPRGYHWVRDDDGDFILVRISNGLVFDLRLGG